MSLNNVSHFTPAALAISQSVSNFLHSAESASATACVETPALIETWRGVMPVLANCRINGPAL